MTQPVNQLVARAERERLRWMSDDELEAAVETARPFLDCEDVFVAHVQVAMLSLPGALHGEPVAPAVRAILYLARHGIPHGLPSAD